MANCDICGKDENLFRAEIEGTKLNVCENCAKHGEVIAPIKNQTEKESRKQQMHEIKEEEKKNLIYMVNPEFHSIIRNKRSKLGLDQKEFAKKISEKESVVQKMETGDLKPSLKLARKLEMILGVKLIEAYEEEKEFSAKTETKEFTIGDILKIRKKS